MHVRHASAHSEIPTTTAATPAPVASGAAGSPNAAAATAVEQKVVAFTTGTWRAATAFLLGIFTRKAVRDEQPAAQERVPVSG